MYIFHLLRIIIMNIDGLVFSFYLRDFFQYLIIWSSTTHYYQALSDCCVSCVGIHGKAYDIIFLIHFSSYNHVHVQSQRWSYLQLSKKCPEGPLFILLSVFSTDAIHSHLFSPVLFFFLLVFPLLLLCDALQY